MRYSSDDLPLNCSKETSWMGVEGDGVVLHTVKPAEDGSGDMVLRLYECDGKYSSAT